MFRPRLVVPRLATKATLLFIGFTAVFTALGPAMAGAGSQLFNSDGTWNSLTGGFPSGRRAAGYCYDSLRRRLIVFGGFPTYLNDVWALDLATSQWTQLTPTGYPPNPCYGPTAIYDSARDRVVVFGGFDGTNQLQSVFALSLSGTPGWSQLTPSGTPPPGRSFHVAGYDASNDRMIVFGGWDGTDFLSDTWALSFSGSPAWSQIFPQSNVPPARSLAASAVDPVSGTFYLFGGWNNNYRNDTWAFTLNGTPVWTHLAPASLPPPRREISMIWDPMNGRLVLFAGNDGTLRSDVWALQPAGAPTWTPLSPAPGPAPRYGHSSIYDAVGQQMVIFGGLEDPGQGSDSWALSLSGPPAWHLITMPFEVRNYSAEYDPIAHAMLSFGGEEVIGASVQLGNDLRMLPLIGGPANWQTVIPSGAPPTPRYAARTIWDPVRDRMLLFSGYDFDFLNDLWEYHPRPVPSWNHLITTGTPPVKRFAGGAVYDAPRDRMLIFGGYNPDSMGQSLGDLWEIPLSGPNALKWNQLFPTGSGPSRRWGFVMLSDPTRQRALVMGGSDNSNVPGSDVYALDLAASPPAWSTLAPAGTPPPGRIIHAAVLDPVGDRLVVFGGWSGTDALNDVYSLSLSGTPTWTLLSPTGGPPLPRDAIVAVYDPIHFGLVVGGGARDGLVFYSDTWSLNWDQPVAAKASLVDAHAEAGLVRIQWSLSDAGAADLTVERQRDHSGWLAVAAPTREGADRHNLEDRTVPGPGRYQYRLLAAENGAQTVVSSIEIEVPSGFQLALAGARPNPSSGASLNVAFTLERKGSARLDLLDVAGRRVASTDLGGFEAGNHVLSVAGAARFEPGLYLLRLSAGGRTLTSKAMVIR